MNAVGLVDCLKQNFGSSDGNWARFLQEGRWWEYMWATVVLSICTLVCLAGSAIFAKASNALLALLLISTFSIPFSTFIMYPFREPNLGIHYTGYRVKTFLDNLFPAFTKHADGSHLPGKENFQDLFGVLFPATGGIFAGASMSGDLKDPSKAIPKGTLAGLALTFGTYTIVILCMAATVTRESFYNNVNIIQDTNISGALILVGELASTFFSSLMGVVGSAKLLQAIARDHIIPGLSPFGHGTVRGDEPIYAIFITHVLAQVTMLFDINQIASFVTMAYLMTFLVTNLACFLLKISSAPNFRPSFRYFNWQIAAFGTLISGASMFFVDGFYATGCVSLLIAIFLIIHYTTPPKAWGDVSQSLIYHQVRKYLLRLRQEHVKFWRPQILLLINDPRRQYKLIQFCNALKKGALFVLGHVIVSDDFGDSVPEARKQQTAWMKYIDFSKVKAFIDIAIAPTLEWGARNLLMNAGLGGMRPNIVVMGMYNLDLFRAAQPLIDMSGVTERGPELPRRESDTERIRTTLPTDTNRQERDITPAAYVTILEDLLLRLRINVAIAKGFKGLELPKQKKGNGKKYIDLWPIQMSAQLATEESPEKQNILTTNFDTYTLILQLGCILNTVPKWKKTYKLRVAVFVEYESDVEEERTRLKALLAKLRIAAEILVLWLASGNLQTYQIVVNGSDESTDTETTEQVDEVLKDEEWWEEIQNLRGKRSEPIVSEQLSSLEEEVPGVPLSAGLRKRRLKLGSYHNIQNLVRSLSRRRSTSNVTLAPRLTMTTQRLDKEVVNSHGLYTSASESSNSDDEPDLEIIDSDSEPVTLETRRPSIEENFRGRVAERLWRSRRRSDEEVPRPRPDMLATKAPEREDQDEQRLLTPSEPAKTPRTPGMPTTPSDAPLKTPLSMHSARSVGSRPRPSRRSSAAKFSSHPVPETTVATEDGPGPSIMFTEPERRSPLKQSIYDRATPSTTGFPSPQSIPLSFNDLPARAQHLILNELIRRHCSDTAVILTTLPSPDEGTCKSEEDSLGYLSDLEVLCKDLPPTLLVQSNTLSVTVAL